MGMKIELDLADLGMQYDPTDGQPLGPGSFNDLVVNAAASQIVDGMDDRQNLERAVRDRVSKRVESIADELIAELIEGVLENPIQRTTTWGEAKGEPTTVREIVRTKVEAFLSEPQSRDPYRSRNDPPASLTDLIAKITTDAMQRELKPVIDEAKKSIHTHVTSVALEAAVAALTPKG